LNTRVYSVVFTLDVQEEFVVTEAFEIDFDAEAIEHILGDLEAEVRTRQFVGRIIERLVQEWCVARGLPGLVRRVVWRDDGGEFFESMRGMTV
jgi:hypothetical protein